MVRGTACSSASRHSTVLAHSIHLDQQRHFALRRTRCFGESDPISQAATRVTSDPIYLTTTRSSISRKSFARHCAGTLFCVARIRDVWLRENVLLYAARARQRFLKNCVSNELPSRQRRREREMGRDIRENRPK